MMSRLYFTNISVKILPNNIKMDIFEIYTEGLLKNVQDGISRPIGSREIHKARRIGGFFESPFR